MSLLSGDDPASVEAAARRLARGDLVAFPTETVYGLGARADDDAAVARLYAAKGRPSAHPLIVHVARADAAAVFSGAAPSSAFPASAARLIAAFWPGPLTVIVPRRRGHAAAAAGGQDSIGLRMPQHPVALALLQAAARLGVPGVAAPSANRFGRISPTCAAHVVAEFGPDLAVLDGGDCEIGIESTIVDCTRSPAALLRPGQLSRAAIETVLGQALAAPDAASPRASGTLASHYAPAARLQLFDADTLQQCLAELACRSVGAPADSLIADAGAASRAQPGTAVYSRAAPPPGSAVIHRTMPADARAAAHELFAVLRAFDAMGVASIWVEQPPPDPTWEGVRDRLQRAAA
ncbi:MAG: L-threonylcarbamoyladenylate synthase [Rubrivivax sp.]